MGHSMKADTVRRVGLFYTRRLLLAATQLPGRSGMTTL